MTMTEALRIARVLLSSPRMRIDRVAGIKPTVDSYLMRRGLNRMDGGRSWEGRQQINLDSRDDTTEKV